MSIIKIIEKISSNSELSERIMDYYEGNFKIKRTSFQKFCNKNYIDVAPTILFDFFDSINLKIAITPIENTDFWCCRIFLPKSILITEHYTRKDATIQGLQKVVDLYINGYEI